jgi:hypothetical protein
MSDIAEVAPLSDGVQTALRLPVILIALAGIVLALVFAKRNGVISAVFGVLGSALLAADQVVNIWWVLYMSALARSAAPDESFTTANNLFTLGDVVLVTAAGAALVVAFTARRRAAVPAPAFPPPVPAFAPPPAFSPPPPGPYQP